MARRKRGNAEGSIYKNETRGRWEAKLVVGRKPDGSLQRRTFTAKTRAAVEKKLNEARAALDQGLDIPDNRATVETFATWWLDEVLPGEGLAPKTEQWYREMVTNYVLHPDHGVGARALTGRRALTPADVEAMGTRLAKAGLSHRVQVASRTTLGKILRAAEQRGLVSRNVARLASPPRNRGKARKVKALTVSDVAGLVDALEGSRWLPVVVVGVTTGLRPGELLALHWTDVHLDTEPQVSVRLSISHVDGPSLKAPKRDRSYRTVPLPPEAVAALKAWRKTQAEERLAAGPLWSNDWPDLVFTTPDGRPQRVDNFRQSIIKTVELAGNLPHVHPHMLRHTYATHLLEAAVPIHHVAELLGDAVATVEATYSHVLRPKHETAAVASGLLGGGP